MADADHARLAASQLAQVAHQLRVGRFADQQPLDSNASTKAVTPRITPMTIDAAPS